MRLPLLDAENVVQVRQIVKDMLRGLVGGSGGGPGVMDHGALSGLSDDDHTQYLNNVRHDTPSRHTLGVVVPHDDHGALLGLGDDDHAIYSLVDGTRAFTGVVGGIVPTLAAHLATKGYVDGVVITDHGALNGLGDDDHTQYLLANGTRALTGNWDVGDYDLLNVDLLDADSIQAGTASHHVDLDHTGIVYTGTARPKRTLILTAAGGWPSITAGCEVNLLVEYGTNDVNIYHLDFDPSTDEHAEWTIALPDSWDGGTVVAVFYWTAASGSGAVVWKLQGRSYADSDAIDQSWGTAQEVVDTLITANDVHKSSATPAITLAGGPAGGELVQLRVQRDADNGSDTLGVDARLIAVKIEFTVTQESD